MKLNELFDFTKEVCEKFINKCETGRARSIETLSDLRKLKASMPMSTTPRTMSPSPA